MKRYIFSLTLTLLLITPLLAEAGEHYIKIQITDRQELDSLTRIVSISSVRADTVFAYANDKQIKAFQGMGYQYQEVSHPSTLTAPQMATDLEDMAEWDKYPSYDQYLAMMYQFETDYPDLCEIYLAGYSVEGREILFARISDNAGTAENEPEVLYTSTMHGDETTGYVLMLRLIDSLLTTYGSDPGVTNLVNNLEIWINPLANPDGTYASGDGSVYGATRTNANYVDLNRNFPDPAYGDHPDGNDWQQETIVMMDFAASRNIVMAANFHGGIEVVNYPWDTWPHLHADDVWYRDISRDYADSAQENSPSGYMEALDDGITHGYSWYPVHGGRQDYMVYWHGCRETVIELSDIKLVSASTLPSYWEYNRVSFMNYIGEALYGVRGVVTDIEVGLPVGVIITVLNHDIDSSMVFSDPETGNYHRMIEPGTYDIRFDHPDYEPFIAYGVVVNDDDITILDIELVPYAIQLVCGDANGDEDANPMDALYLVDYFYRGGPAPVTPAAVDVDNSGDVNPLDLLYLVDYLYRAGPDPNCGE